MFLFIIILLYKVELFDKTRDKFIDRLSLLLSKIVVNPQIQAAKSKARRSA